MTARGYLWTLVLLAVLGTGYVLEQDRVHAFFNPEVRGISPVSGVQERAISSRLDQGVTIRDAFSIRSDVHENAQIVAAKIDGNGHRGSVGLWVLPGSRRGPTGLISANDAARDVTSVDHERISSTKAQRLSRYVQAR